MNPTLQIYPQVHSFVGQSEGSAALYFAEELTRFQFVIALAAIQILYQGAGMG